MCEAVVMHGSSSVCPPSGPVSMNTDVAIAHAEVLGSTMASRMDAYVRAKREKHAAASRRLGRVFIPLVLNGLGGGPTRRPWICCSVWQSRFVRSPHTVTMCGAASSSWRSGYAAFPL